MFQPPTSVYYQKQQQHQSSSSSSFNDNNQFDSNNHFDDYNNVGSFSSPFDTNNQQQQRKITATVMKSVLGVIIPPALSDPTAHSQTFPGGIKGSIATELRSAASQDRYFFHQLRVARGKSLLLRTALVKKVKEFEGRHGEFNEASFD